MNIDTTKYQPHPKKNVSRTPASKIRIDVKTKLDSSSFKKINL